MSTLGSGEETSTPLPSRVRLRDAEHALEASAAELAALLSWDLGLYRRLRRSSVPLPRSRSSQLDELLSRRDAIRKVGAQLRPDGPHAVAFYAPYWNDVAARIFRVAQVLAVFAPFALLVLGSPWNSIPTITAIVIAVAMVAAGLRYECSSCRRVFGWGPLRPSRCPRCLARMKYYEV